MSDVLSRICEEKLQEIARRKTQRSLPSLEAEARTQSSPRGFVQSLRKALKEGGYGVITEIKKASPSRGLIRKDFDPPSLARAYAAGGATCLSVLTDGPYFQGQDADLIAARAVVDLPVLRKDFILDPYQVVEARAIGADCILLIMAALSDKVAEELEATALALGMDVLVEVHDAIELARAVKLRTPLLGINNRNLKTLEIDLSVTETLAALVPPDRLLVSESGIHTPADLLRVSKAGPRCFLVGESLMRQADVTTATRNLITRPAA